MGTRKNMDIAYNAAYKIQQFWKGHKLKNKFTTPRVIVNATTGELVSDMVDGYPPAIKTMVR